MLNLCLKINSYNRSVYSRLISILINKAIGSLIYINYYFYIKIKAIYKKKILLNVLNMHRVIMFIASINIQFLKPLVIL